MKGLASRPLARPAGALWLGAPLVLAACVAAEAAPQDCGALDRAPAQASLSRWARDGVARLARSTRQTIGQAQVTFVLLTLERLAGGTAASVAWHCGPDHVALSSSNNIRTQFLDPGRTSSPTAAP